MAAKSVARHAEVVHVQNRDDLGTRVKHSSDNRCVHIRNKIFEHRRTAARRYACHANALFDSDALALELAARRTLYAASKSDGVERISLVAGARGEPAIWITSGRTRRRHRMCIQPLKDAGKPRAHSLQRGDIVCGTAIWLAPAICLISSRLGH
jgi:hypothetical protein